MLTSIVLKLRARKTEVIPGHLGRANFAETLKRLGEFESGLDQWIHDAHTLKPITCSSLLGPLERVKTKSKIKAGESYWVRLTTLNDVVSEVAAQAFWQNRPRTWRLGPHTFDVTDVICDPTKHKWSGATTCEELAQRYLLTPMNSELNRVTFHFLSATSFKSKGMQMPMPMPGLLFGSLLNRWNSVSDVELPQEMRNFSEEVIAVGQFNLKTVVVPQKGKGIRAGAIGDASYTALYDDHYWLGLFQLLADFALYSGVGVQTSTGMGQVRRLEQPENKKKYTSKKQGYKERAKSEQVRVIG